ncbi:hypothetical protein AQB9606_01470 [Aquabacterium sp. CECT 9606]|nr:hypothetical protein AQB9606_01470 [Aquabacterium sp. CECT 9606]
MTLHSREILSRLMTQCAQSLKTEASNYEMGGAFANIVVECNLSLDFQWRTLPPRACQSA